MKPENEKGGLAYNLFQGLKDYSFKDVRNGFFFFFFFFFYYI